MGMEYITQEYGSSKGILVFPDHYVAVGIKHAKAASGSEGLAVLVDGHYIVKAGTIYPSNDANAIGVVLNDVDVTYGDKQMAIVLHGFVSKAKLPVALASTAEAAMPNITFLPKVPYATITLTCTDAEVAVGAEPADFTVTVAINNATFRAEAATLSNWTIANAATVKLNATAVTLAADMKSVTFTVESTAAAVAGELTVRPSAACISLGSQPAAVTIVTVA